MALQAQAARPRMVKMNRPWPPKAMNSDNPYCTDTGCGNADAAGKRVADGLPMLCTETHINCVNATVIRRRFRRADDGLACLDQ